MNMQYTHISVVLDRSGSMQSVANDTVGGFNKFLKDQKEVSGKGTISLSQFDHEYEEVYKGKDLQEAEELTDKTYVPRGQTALLDAIGRTINTTGEWLRNMKEEDRPGKILFIIITDGLENNSHEFSKEKIVEMIKQQTDIYNWAFVYLGANQDAIAEGHSYGIGKGSSFTYMHNGAGVKHAFMAASMGTTGLRWSGKTAREYTDSTSFFNEKDRQKV